MAVDYKRIDDTEGVGAVIGVDQTTSEAMCLQKCAEARICRAITYFTAVSRIQIPEIICLTL